MTTQTTYLPESGDWPQLDPSAAGMDPDLLKRAVESASAAQSEVEFPKRDLPAAHTRFMERQPHGAVVGPLRGRGGPAGLIVRDGALVAEWGETDRADTTFSVTKSFISTAAGLAFDRRLFGSIRDRVCGYITDPAFEDERHQAITFEHLLQNRSEWEGTLWDKPDTADRRAGPDRELQFPGTFWEYNDVRVNLAAYAVLLLHKRPLPVVVREAVMDPIGCTQDWEWHGYSTSTTKVGGVDVESVAGGGHWGGGLMIGARDMARYGLLYLNRGRWGSKQVLSEEWMIATTTPCPIRRNYGLLWWLNQPVDGAQLFPGAPATAYAARGYGGNTVYVDPENGLVVVTRWITDDAIRDTIRLAVEACR